MTGLQLALKFIEIGFIAVLARLLLPADFGIIAGAMIFVQLAALLVEIGIGATLIQLPTLTALDKRVAGTLTMLNALFYCGLTYLCAPLIGALLQLDGVVPVIRVLGLLFPIQAIGIVSEALLVRDLRVKEVMLAQVAARLLGTGVIGIALAFMGYGYWALVAATLAETGIKAAILYTVVRQPLRPSLARENMLRLVKKSSGFSASRLINFAALKADSAIIARTMDAAALGLYSRAYNLMNVPADLYGRIAERVIFPAMAQVQTEPERLRRAFVRGLELTAVIGMPMAVALAVLAPEIILVILGPQWVAVIEPFAWLSAATYLRLGAKISGSLQRAKGAIGPMIRSQIVYAGAVIGGCLIAYPYGIVAVAQAVVVAVAAFYVVTSVNAARLAGIGIGGFATAHGPGALTALLYAAVLVPAVMLLRGAGLSPLLVLAGAGAISGIGGLVIALLRPRALIGAEAAGLMQNLMARVRRKR